MGTYRDDLDAALARNHALEQRVKELEGALEQRAETTQRGHAAARSAPKPAPTVTRPTAKKRASRIVYAAPATYAPCVRQYARYLALSWRDLRGKLPSANVPAPPASNIVVLELLRRLLLVVWIPLALFAEVLWFFLRSLGFVFRVPLVGAATVVVSVLLVPVLVLGSIRVQRPGTAPVTGVRWSAEVDDATAKLYGSTCLASLLGLVPVLGAVLVAAC